MSGEAKEIAVNRRVVGGSAREVAEHAGYVQGAAPERPALPQRRAQLAAGACQTRSRCGRSYSLASAMKSSVTHR
jgi:hypothetical protein